MIQLGHSKCAHHPCRLLDIGCGIQMRSLGTKIRAGLPGGRSVRRGGGPGQRSLFPFHSLFHSVNISCASTQGNHRELGSRGPFSLSS